MVGWNVAVTYLVAGQLHLQDKYSLVIFNSVIYLLRNYYEFVECLLNIQVEFTVVIFSCILHMPMLYGFQCILLEFMEARSLFTESECI